MKEYTQDRRYDYTPEQIFDLIADVEHYADFLQDWRYARILNRQGNTVYIEQEVALSVLHARFTTQAVLKRPVRIDIVSTDGPFRQLTIQWIFEPVNLSGCLLKCRVGLELRSRVFQKLFVTLFSDHLQRIIEAFEERAKLIYAAPEKHLEV